jgi:nitroimidazol reductase NimA-like FMN-containing flavoprotein (pyridoxamine 5'-phosphate oxidase superfamily)
VREAQVVDVLEGRGHLRECVHVRVCMCVCERVYVCGCMYSWSVGFRSRSTSPFNFHSTSKGCKHALANYSLNQPTSQSIT